MATITWKATGTGAWGAAANWSTGAVPTSTDTAIISTAAAASITVNAGNTTVGGLTTASLDTLSIGGGNWTSAGASTLGGGLTITSGSGTFKGTSSVAGKLNVTGGTLSVGTGATLTASGAATLDTQSTFSGAGTLVTSGTVTLVPTGSYVFMGQGLTWNNAGVVNASAYIYEGISAGTETFTLNNQFGATYNLTNDLAGLSQYQIIGTFKNAGTLAKTGGTGTSAIYANFSSTGTINVATGTIALQDGATISGTVSGAGTLNLAGGLDTIANTASVSVGALALTGGTLSETTGSLAGIASKLYVTGGTVAIASGATFTASAGGVFDTQASFAGPGTLVTAGTVSLVPTGSYVFMGQGLTWNNTGVVNATSSIYEGVSGTSETFTLNNQAGGSFNLTTDQAGLQQYYITGTFNNYGTLAKTGGTGASGLVAFVNSTGTLNVATGTIALENGSNLSGTITGAGTLNIAGGLNSIANTANFSVGALTVTGGTLSETTGSLAGVASKLYVTGGTVAIASGATFTASAGGVFDTQASFAGPGTLATAGTVSLVSTGSYVFMGQGLTWNNAGVVNANAAIYEGVSGTSETFTLNNQTGANFNLTTDQAGLQQYYITGTLNNAGTLAKTGGTGISYIDAALNSTGTLNVATGTIALENGSNLAGTITGAGTLNIAGGLNSISSTANFSVGALTVTGGTLSETTGSLAGVASKLYVTGGTVAIASGATFTASAGGVFDTQASFAGPGTLVTAGTVSLAPSSYILMGQGLTWNNTGVVNAANYIAEGLSSSLETLTLNNQAGATFNLTTDAAGLAQQYIIGTFNNAGTLAKTGGTGTSHIYATVTGGGTITASTGTLELDNGGTLSGTIGGTSLGQVHLLSGFTAAGGLTVLDNSSTTSLNIAAGATLTDTGIINDAGVITVGSSGTQGTISIAAGAALDFTTNDASLTGTASFTNAGTIAKTGGTGPSTIGVAITNTGIVEAAIGTLKLNGAVSGSGMLKVDGGATLEIAGASTSVGAKTVVSMFSGGATLKLDKDITFTNAITGLGAGDRIDLVGMSVASAVISGTTLTVTPTVGSALNYVSTTALTGLGIGTVSDGAGGTTVSLYRAATAGVHTPEPVVLGPTHVGTPVTATVSIANTAPGDGFSEALDATLSGSGTGYSSAGSFTGLAGGQTNSTGLTVTLAATAAGTVTGAASLALSSDGTGIDNRGTTSLGTQTVNISGAVYAYAQPSLPALVLNLGATRVGGAALSGNAVLANTLVAPAGYEESLVYAAGTTPAAVSIANGSGTIAAGATAALAVTLASTSAGDFTGTQVAIADTSSGTGTSGLGATVLNASTLTVNGQVYAPATAKLGATSLNFGIVHVGDVVAPGTISVSNGNAAGTLSDVLTAGTVSEAGSYTGAVSEGIATAGLAPGASGSVTFGLNTATAGTQSGTETLGFGSHDSVLSDIAAAAATVTVSATVDNYALATLQSISGPALTGSGTVYTLNLGTLQVPGTGTATVSANLGVLNSASGIADLLSGSFTITGTGASSFTNTGFTTFSGLTAGQNEAAQIITMSSVLTPGTYSEKIVLTPTGSNASGYSGVLASQTINVTGTVVNSGSVYTLTRAPVIITGGGGNDTFNATSGTLNSRDQLDGGAGTNTLVLKNGGFFDLGAPKVLTNMQVVQAAEGQAAIGTFPDTSQTVYLRDGLDLTVNVTAGTAATGDTSPESIQIYGGVNNDVINLSTGSDTVVLAGSGTSVYGGSGASLVQAPASVANALVVGIASGASATTLEITNAGTVALNAGDNNLVVKLDAASTLTLNGMSFISVIGQVAGNTEIAGAAGQTLGGNAGGDTLTGYSGFGTTFSGTAAGLVNDIIGNFGGSDIIDITNMNFATLKPLTYTAGTGKGTLTVTDGTHTDKLTITGSYALTNFVAASDTHTGTAISWHS